MVTLKLLKFENIIISFDKFWTSIDRKGVKLW